MSQVGALRASECRRKRACFRTTNKLQRILPHKTSATLDPAWPLPMRPNPRIWHREPREACSKRTTLPARKLIQTRSNNTMPHSPDIASSVGTFNAEQQLSHLSYLWPYPSNMTAHTNADKQIHQCSSPPPPLRQTTRCLRPLHLTPPSIDIHHTRCQHRQPRWQYQKHAQHRRE